MDLLKQIDTNHDGRSVKITTPNRTVSHAHMSARNTDTCMAACMCTWERDEQVDQHRNTHMWHSIKHPPLTHPHTCPSMAGCMRMHVYVYSRMEKHHSRSVGSHKHTCAACPCALCVLPPARAPAYMYRAAAHTHTSGMQRRMVRGAG